jgi:tRNA G37 N-methylase Trm5
MPWEKSNNMVSAITVNDVVFNVDEKFQPEFWTIVNEGRWERETFHIMDRFLKPDWRFVDIGAWIGPTALYAARKCETVDAYECDPVALRELRNNLRLNLDLRSKVEIHEFALGEAEGFLRLWAP